MSDSPWVYEDSRGERVRLTQKQYDYLVVLKSVGEISSDDGHPQFHSTLTARVLQERGLARLTQRCGRWTLSAITDRGRAVVEAIQATQVASR